MLDTAYGMLAEFFALDAELKAAVDGAGHPRPDRLHRAARRDGGHRRRRRLEGDAQLGRAGPGRAPAAHQVPAPLPRPRAPRRRRARHPRACCCEMHDRVVAAAAPVPARHRRRPRRRTRTCSTRRRADAPDLTRAIHYPSMELAPGAGHVWAAEHGDINLITALPAGHGEGPAGARPATGGSTPRRPTGHVVINTGIMLDRISNGVIPSGHAPRRRRPRRARRAHLGRAVLPPDAVDGAGAAVDVHHRRTTRSATSPSTPARCSTRSCGRSTSSRTAAAATSRV